MKHFIEFELPDDEYALKRCQFAREAFDSLDEICTLCKSVIKYGAKLDEEIIYKIREIALEPLNKVAQ